MSVRDELRNEATRLNIKGRSKMTKDELVGAIQDTPGNWLVITKSGDIRITEPDPTDVAAADAHEEWVRDNDTQTSAYAVDTETIGQEIVHVSQPAQSPSPVTTRTSRPDTRNRAETLAWIEEEVAAGRMPFPYGLRGRGVGAKTYNQVSDRTLNRQIKAHTRAAQNHPLSSPAKLPNSERVQKYARANGTLTLTHAQWKRVLKKTNWEDDITVTTLPQDKSVFSHIGTTPRGCFINFQFSR